MKLLKLSAFLVFCTTPLQAAVSILIESGAPGTSVFTITQTAPNPLYNVVGIGGYASGMSLPTSMFNIPDLGSGGDIMGDLLPSVATIREIFSNRSYQLTGLVISSDGSPSLLRFNQLYTLGGASHFQFSVTTSAPVVTNIPMEALYPGVHTISDTLFGLITVTVVPEPGSLALFAGAAIPFAMRRRR